MPRLVPLTHPAANGSIPELGAREGRQTGAHVVIDRDHQLRKPLGQFVSHVLHLLGAGLEVQAQSAGFDVDVSDSSCWLLWLHGASQPWRQALARLDLSHQAVVALAQFHQAVGFRQIIESTRVGVDHFP